jgi:hypothetical protein
MRTAVTALLVAGFGCSYPFPEAFIVAVSPEPDAPDVDSYATIAVEVRALAEEAVDGDSLQVWQGNRRIAGGVSVSPAPRGDGTAEAYPAIVFSPQEPLTAGKHTCVLAGTFIDESGQPIGREYRWSFVVTQRVWDAGRRLDVEESSDVRVAISGDSATAMWLGASQLRAAVLVDGYWLVQDIGEIPAQDVFAFTLAASSSSVGRAWIQRDEGGRRVWTQSAYLGSANKPLAVGDPGVDITDLVYAVAPGGDRLAVWQQGGAIWASRFRRQRDFEPPWKVGPDQLAPAGVAAAWIGDSRAVVVMPTFNGTDSTTTWWATHLVDDEWTAAIPIETRSQAIPLEPRLTANEAGSSLILSWVEHSDERTTRVKRWTSTAGWKPSQVVDSNVTDFAVAVDSAGQATVAWVGVEEEMKGSWFARVDDDGVLTPRSVDLGLLAVTLRASPTAGVILVGKRNGGGIEARRVDARGTLSAIEPVGRTSLPAPNIHVDVSRDRRGLVVWEDESATSAGVILNTSAYR